MLGKARLQTNAFWSWRFWTQNLTWKSYNGARSVQDFEYWSCERNQNVVLLVLQVMGITCNMTRVVTFVSQITCYSMDSNWNKWRLTCRYLINPDDNLDSGGQVPMNRGKQTDEMMNFSLKLVSHVTWFYKKKNGKCLAPPVIRAK